MPQPPARAFSQKDLPPSVESAYYRKCIDLRRRINDIEENNDGTRLRITRLNRGIQKMRLERAFLLEQLNKHMEYNVDDSDRSSSPPPTPTDKPLRSKRSHNRKGTPPAGAQVGGLPGGMQHQSPGSTHHQSLLHQMNPMSSAQSTPDPSRQPNSYFSTVGAAATSPHAVNGAAVLPPLHSLPPLHPQQQSAQRAAYFDPAYDEQRPTPVDHEGDGGRRRAYSGAQQPSAETAPPQNGDTEMTDAGFTAVNR
ncbi:hypothetical protein N0V83_009785 [Neocucurbitaria cava]|uniref:INO80 complex subunit F domain-containing protein n=1 Tax=Neocucurbitaria cava TaxID=798079 RepID=A0A9W8XZQ7_9PLEO|nr:hypothetical protein N0V83_009785 [Neocucurbitaria cava]